MLKEAARRAADDEPANGDAAAGGSHSGGTGAGGSGTGQSTGGRSDMPEAQVEETKDTEPPPWKHFWYEFKGECYLHGMMDGEAMREKFYQEKEDWIFELR